jgi:predicted permease
MQLLSEAGALALASGAVGTALAVVGVRLLRTFGPGDLPRLGAAGLDPVVLAWALGLSLMAALFVGVAPAATIVGRNVRLPVSEGGRGGTAGMAARGIRRGLVVAEFAVAIILLAGSGLLIRSWMSLSSVDPGFDPARTLSLNLSTSAYPTDEARTAFYAALLERVTATSGVEAAGLIGDFFTDGDTGRTLTPEGAGAPVQVVLRADEVSEHLFSTVGAPILSGRAFTAADGPEAPPVAIVNEALADRLFPGSEAVGRRFKNGPPDAEQPWVTIVGVVSDMRRQGLDVAPIPQSFVPLAQNPSRSETLLVRTSSDDPLDLAPAVRAAVAAIDPRVPLYFLSSLDDAMGADLAQRRFQTSLLVAFALLALAMAAIGIYGLIHYSVAARRREFAIRMAVGARAGDIFGISIAEGLRLSAIGLGLGIPGALIAGRAGTSLLYGVSPTDPTTLVSVSVLLLFVAVSACVLPARGATRIDPLEALRPE